LNLYRFHYYSSGRGLGLQQLLQNIVLRQPVRFRMEVQQNAMPQNRDVQRADVLVADVIAARISARALAASTRNCAARTLPP
jgi:hypothetical protein